MSLRDINQNASLSSIEEEMAFTEANLAADPLTESHAPDAAAHVARVEAVRAEQKAGLRRAIRAQAKINYLNRALDGLTRDLVLILLATYKTRDAAGYRLYFPKEAPSVVIRKALEGQLDDCERWPEHLAAESADALRAFAPRFAQVIADGQAAVQARADEKATASTHRLRVIEPLITDLNAYRQRAYGALLTLGTDSGFEKSWAREFFM
jgi:hypothetical protein